MADIIPLGGYYSALSPPFKLSCNAMTLRISPSMSPAGAALGMRWLVPLVILFGMMLSSIGSTSSHGLAVIAAALHVAPSTLDEPHGHMHEEQSGELAMTDQIADVDHPHHGADHSHDTSLALPVTWSSAAAQLRGWRILVRPWIELVQASRLERPPTG